MSYVGIAVMGFSAAQQIVGGQNDKDMAKAQGYAIKQQGVLELQKALEDARIIRRRGKESVAEIAASYAGSGVRVDTGTPVEVIAQEQRDVEHDATQAILQGARRQNTANAQANQARAVGGAAAANANAGAFATVLEGGYGTYMRMRDSGWFTRSGPAPGGSRPAATPSAGFNNMLRIGG